MLKKYGLWIAVALAAYMFKDKWMPLLGLGGNSNDLAGSDKAVGTTEDYNENDFA